jgi:hypothetical protein
VLGKIVRGPTTGAILGEGNLVSFCALCHASVRILPALLHVFHIGSNRFVAEFEFFDPYGGKLLKNMKNGGFEGTLLVLNITLRNTQFKTMAYCLLHGPHAGMCLCPVTKSLSITGEGLHLCENYPFLAKTRKRVDHWSAARVVNIEYRYRHRYYRRYFRRIDIDIDDTFMSKYRKRYRRYFWGRFVRYFDIDTFELI